jgi:hypothetical protein
MQHAGKIWLIVHTAQYAPNTFFTFEPKQALLRILVIRDIGEVRRDERASSGEGIDPVFDLFHH